VLDALLAGTGKRVEPAAAARLAELVGEDARTLASELQKLVAYVGDRSAIGAADVDELVVRVAEDKFFALSNAVEARKLEGSLVLLDRTLADGGSIQMVVSLLASTVRRMIEERERARRAAGPRRIGDPAEWERRVWPSVPPEERGEKKPFGFWMKYQASLRFGRDELLRALADLAEADVTSKSGGDARPLVERILMRMMSGPAAQAP
jgi:DNA polymerase-3 subunit delta